MKKHLLIVTVFIAAVAWVDVAVAQQETQCCIYEQTGGAAALKDCTQPANALTCAIHAYSWSEAADGPDPGAPDQLAGNGLGLFMSGPGVSCGNPTCAPVIVLPVELTSFEASYIGGSEVALTWETASETDNAGFYIEHEIGAGEYEELGFVEGAGTITEPRTYTFTASGLDAGVNVFRLKQVDFDGAFEFSNVVEATVDLPSTFVLEPAYPNPFNPSTTIRFGTAVETELTVELYDASGKLVRTLYEGVPEAGALNTVSIDGSGLTSGSYLVKLTSADFQTSQQIVLLK